MNDSDWVLMLARAQFAVTMGMHITLAALTLGLAPFLVWFEARWLWGKQQAARDALHFWLILFSLTVAIGAASGVVMEFQFGTHWAPFSHQVGGVIGPLMFYEVLIAFFLESALTGVMLFGFNKIRPGVHFAVTCLVAIGALFSAFWILAANSWMQTPVGFSRNPQGVFLAESWRSILLAPSFPWRFSHMVVGSLIAVAVLIMGVAAWRLRRFSGEPASRLMLNSALTFLLVAMPLQIVLGDLQGENTRDYQPAKLAAMEGSWHRPAQGEGEPLRLFAIPDQQAQRNHLELSLPDLGSLYLRHNLSGHINSLSDFPADAIPPVLPVFFAFRLMVGLGVLILLTTIAANVQRWRGRLMRSGRLLNGLVWLSPAGFIALLSGWVVTEVGRQPWTVYGLLRTAQSVSPLSLGATLSLFVALLLIYGLVFALGLRYLLRRVKGALPSGEPVVIVLKTPN
ncbi:cytochrome ubiquinol oxidase subunit I [uncultured Pantoea sp.]|uniref:cytochrome ubiquinol oxidase subunit I n=1 Tax=uncultured Pantoea sp. TaxID=218084 RepID=UPI0025ECD46E|nr:cytochrome ubiquinol oxidase subunit I [uncultured Pantoea sp.]